MKREIISVILIIVIFCVIAISFFAITRSCRMRGSDHSTNAYVEKSVVIVGDSLVSGSFISDKLRKWLGTEWTIEQFGIPGESTWNLYLRIDIASEYSYVVILSGVNDIMINPSQTMKNLNIIYRDMKWSDIQVIAITLTPWEGYKKWNKLHQINTDTINRWIMTKPHGIHVIDSHSLLGEGYRSNRLCAEYQVGDNLHLSKKGKLILAIAIYNILMEER